MYGINITIRRLVLLNYFCDKLFIVHAYRTRTGLRIPIYRYLYLLTGRYGGPKKIILCACPQKISCGAVGTLTVQINTNNTVLTDIVCLLTTPYCTTVLLWRCHSAWVAHAAQRSTGKLTGAHYCTKPVRKVHPKKSIHKREHIKKD